ncbi:MAG: proprotein convertase P-domain-containing protein [Planctomycetota bacterium]
MRTKYFSITSQGIVSCIALLSLCAFAPAAVLDWYRTDGVSDGSLNDATDWDVGVPTYFYFDVGDLGANVIELEIRFSALHTYSGDLGAVLTSPQNTSVELFRKIAVSYGSNQANFEDTLFDDDALTQIGPSDAPFNGTYRVSPYSGSATLGNFDGEDPQGTWTLVVSDYFPGDTGSLLAPGDTVSWRGDGALGTRLYITVPEPATLTALLVGFGCAALSRKRRRVRAKA